MTAVFIGDLRPAAETQTRAGLDPAIVAEYAELLLNGEALPPIAVFHDGATYWVGDGFHRIAAALQSHRPELPADIHAGGREDAIWFGLQANVKHGKRETTADKRAKVIRALETFPAKSDRELAKQCGMSYETVRVRRAELFPLPKSDSQPRTGADGRTINTANIGKAGATIGGTSEKKPLMFATRPVAAEKKAKEIARNEAQKQQDQVDAAIEAATPEDRKRRHFLIGLWLVASEHLGNLLGIDPVEFAQLPQDSAYDLQVQTDAQRLTAWASVVEKERRGPLRRVK